MKLNITNRVNCTIQPKLYEILSDDKAAELNSIIELLSAVAEQRQQRYDIAFHRFGSGRCSNGDIGDQNPSVLAVITTQGENKTVFTLNGMKRPRQAIGTTRLLKLLENNQSIFV